MSSPFPTIVADFVAGDGNWPSPPFAWDFEAIDDNALQPCRLQLRDGREFEGDLCRFEPLAKRLLFHPRGASAPVAVPLDKLRACTLTTPLTPRQFAGALPVPEHERGYRTVPANGPAMSGTTMGYVENPCGLFLFPPVDVDRSVLRVFVPRSAYAQAEFGPTAVENAAASWISTPEALLAAIARQATAPVLRIGQAIADLGLATSAQIERALAAQTQDKPLGQILVASGVIAQPDLEAALAYKMGCPLVDVDGFPMDPRAMRLVPVRTAVSLQALPLMLDGERLVLAVASPSREASLRILKMTTGLTPLAVLTRRSALALRLAALTQQDVWEQAIPAEPQAAA